MWNLIKDEYEKQEECDSRIWKYERIQLAQNENTTEDNPLYVPPAVYETVDVDFLSYYARCKIIVTSIMKCISVNTRQLFKEISCESTIRYPNKIDDNPKNLFITFNAWVYSGTDLLWASLLEQMWSRVEEEFGSRQVRLHSAIIRLAKEDLGNTNAGAVDLRTRQHKRYVALLLYRFKFFLSITCLTVFAIILAINPTKLNLEGIVTGGILSFIGSVPFFSSLFSILPLLLKSKGKDIL